MNDREWDINYWIRYKLKNILYCAKRGNKYCARVNADELQGMLLYMQSVGDISEDVYNKVWNLNNLLVAKYSLY